MLLNVIFSALRHTIRDTIVSDMIRFWSIRAVRSMKRLFDGDTVLTTLSRSNHTKVPSYLLNRTVPASDVLSQLAAEDSDRLDFIKAEYKLLVERGEQVPKMLKDAHLLELLCCTSASSRMRYHLFLFKNEKSKENLIAKKKEKVVKHYF